ncbi:hypothetical protein BLX24_25470 [Arsenicibacter rosenii]|uniref:Uncharacterized protein n=1 Tax=Arsenicibacter rosenii TaxID=1750698 RepID=A0A1S2VD95_9BACT|nr:hypothetical protein BLX24_25470 [Arsenicibacter rosenii]
MINDKRAVCRIFIRLTIMIMITLLLNRQVITRPRALHGIKSKLTHTYNQKTSAFQNQLFRQYHVIETSPPASIAADGDVSIGRFAVNDRRSTQHPLPIIGKV